MYNDRDRTNHATVAVQNLFFILFQFQFVLAYTAAGALSTVEFAALLSSVGKQSVQHSGTEHSTRAEASAAQSAQRSSSIPTPSTRSWQTDGGMVPVNWLSFTRNSVRVTNCPGSISGMAPDSELPLRYKSFRTGEDP